MVCIQCYLPPILFMLYMKFIQPIVAPYIQPAITKVITYIWGPQALSSDAACPIRPSRNKKPTTSSGDDSTTTPEEPTPSGSKKQD